MIAAGVDDQLAVLNDKDKPVFFVDADAPPAGEVARKRLSPKFPFTGVREGPRKLLPVGSLEHRKGQVVSCRSPPACVADSV